MSIFQNLYNGRIIPFERRNRHSEEQREIVRKIGEEEKYFAGKIPPEDGERFKELSELYSELSVGEDEKLFTYAFTLGALLMQDMLDEADAMNFI